MPEVVVDEPDPAPTLSDEAIEAWAAVLIDLHERRLRREAEARQATADADQRQAA